MLIKLLFVVGTEQLNRVRLGFGAGKPRIRCSKALREQIFTPASSSGRCRWGTVRHSPLGCRGRSRCSGRARCLSLGGGGGGCRICDS